MTKWHESGRWMLIVALAAQFAGCAQTSQWVSRVTSRHSADKLADVDGRDETASMQKERVKIASEGDARRKPPRSEKPLPQESPKIAAATGMAREEIVQLSDSGQGLRDPFEDKAEDKDAPNRQTASSYLPNPPTTRTDVAKNSERTRVAKRRAVQDASFSDPAVALDAEHEATAEVTTASAVVDESIARKLSRLKPSQASFTQICPEATGDVRELVKSLDDENLEHLKRTLHRLGRIGQDAAPALPALKFLLKHKDGYVRVHSALAMCRIDGISPSALGALTAALKSPDAGLRSFAAAVIAELGPDYGEMTPALAAALKDPDAYVRLHVAEVLIHDAQWSEDSLAVLLKCLQHPDETVRWLTAYSLAELAPQSPDVVEALVVRLKDPSVKVRIGAVYALGEIGPLSKPALSNLQRHAADDNPELRTAVDYAVEQIAGEN